MEVAQRIKETNQSGKTVSNITIIKNNPYPDLYKNVSFIMSLSIGECVIMKNNQGQEVLAKVKQMSPDKESPTSIDIMFWEHTTAKIDGNINKVTPNAFRIRTMRELASRLIRKVTVDPLGRIRRAND